MAPEPVSSEPAILLFDGVCNLCNAWVRFVIRRDPAPPRFRFAALQSEAGQRLLGRELQAMDTFVLIDGGRVFVRSSAALRVLARLGLPWSILYALMKHIGQVGNDDEPVVVGEQQQRLAHDGEDAEFRDEVSDGGVLARHGHCGIEQRFAQGRVLAEHVGEGGELGIDHGEIGPLGERNIEQRSGVTGGSSSIGHGGPGAALELCAFGALELAPSFTSLERTFIPRSFP